MSNYYVGEVIYKTICIDEHEYQVPSVVAKRIQLLDDTLESERERHEKEIAKLSKVATKDFNVVAERIMINLASGTEPSRSDKNFRERFDKGEACLVHRLDFFEKSDGIEPVLEFKHEVKRRIMAALLGQTARGEEYR